jgi:hypothetical protein
MMLYELLAAVDLMTKFGTVFDVWMVWMVCIMYKRQRLERILMITIFQSPSQRMMLSKPPKCSSTKEVLLLPCKYPITNDNFTITFS